MKYLKIILFNLFLTLYSVETLLIFFNNKNNELSSDDIKLKKIEIAKKENLSYDLRERKVVFKDLKEKNKNIKPVFNFAPTFRFSKVFNNALEKNELIPFRGPINSKTLTCAEDLNYKLVTNDKYGFKNYNETYDKKINTIILGNSFAVGLCQNNDNDFTGNLNRQGINTINLGVSGSSALISLAIITEFGNYFSPKNIVYLYYEGNDLEGLEWERNIPLLMNYYNDENFNNDYLNRYNEINKFLYKAEIESLKEIYKEGIRYKSKKYTLKEYLVDFIELKKTKKIIREKILNKSKKNFDEKLLIETIIKIKNKSLKYADNFLFVYIPDSSRYINNKLSFDQKRIFSYKDKIINELKKEEITIIDLTEFFDKDKNPRLFYPFGFNGHFNKKGYKEISKVISRELKR